MLVKGRASGDLLLAFFRAFPVEVFLSWIGFFVLYPTAALLWERDVLFHL